MNAPTQAPYRPQKTGNAVMDEALRKAFDYIYVLQAQVNTLLAAQSSAAASTKTTTQATTVATVQTKSS
jgi:hypothetical protein